MSSFQNKLWLFVFFPSNLRFSLNLKEALFQKVSYRLYPELKKTCLKLKGRKILEISYLVL